MSPAERQPLKKKKKFISLKLEILVGGRCSSRKWNLQYKVLNRNEGSLISSEIGGEKWREKWPVIVGSAHADKAAVRLYQTLNRNVGELLIILNWLQLIPISHPFCGRAHQRLELVHRRHCRKPKRSGRFISSLMSPTRFVSVPSPLHKSPGPLSKILPAVRRVPAALAKL